ncbi:alanine racemase, partial [uncultured Aquincola sp.]|uniref:alanine racemase n=1 Tax=uncultured Aquincola sp. TaxID=886556 RepID=UPI0032B29164
MHDTPALPGASRAQVNAGAWLDIDLAAIVHNWRLLKQQANGRADCAAVVKADAYGLGAAPVATALHAAGCRRFFVAHLDEGLTLRPLLPADATLFVMHGLLPGSELEAVTHG